MVPNHYTQTQATDEEDSDSSKDGVFSIFEANETVKVLHVYFSNAIESDRVRYHKLLHQLRTAKDYEYVILYLACYGGDVYSGTQIINALQDCPVPVHIVVDTPCFSMASVIALQGNSLVMKDETYLMFHNYSGGNYGKGHELFTAAAHYDEFSRKGTERQLSPFLTKAEINRLPKDLDVYINFDDADLPARLKRHFKARNGKFK